MDETHFNNVSMKESDFADMYMVNTKFLGVNLSNSRFGCSIMNNVEFKNPDLKNSQFIHCDLTRLQDRRSEDQRRGYPEAA